ncbi:UbiA family prenyltransferase [Streptomyces roseofulvus]|uniref:UbiA family prenyltransferase n=2 Tax=Streptomyces TaxID=1883 RepID=A0ABU4K2G1_9ACTN|nr:UbiA family prenyltransferase [Streptomyces roseolus]MDX2291950.1 UbiA family prenyltransferase [Streptomyces roseolus]
MTVTPHPGPSAAALPAAPLPGRLFTVARHCVAEARPVVQLVFLTRFLLGALCAAIAGGARPAPQDVLAGAASLSLAVLATYLLNGVMDIAEDRGNGSRRPIARGDLPARTGAKVAAGSAVVSLLLAASVPGLAAPVAVLLLLGWAYSMPPFTAKRRTWAGAVVVTVAGLAAYLAGAVAVHGSLAGGPLALCGVLALWMGAVGAVSKDLSDVRGDALAGRVTFAVVRGERAARRLVAVAAPVLGAAGLAVAALSDPVVFAGAVPLAAGSGWVAWRCLRPRPDRARAPYRAFMVTQYAANAGLAAGLLALG